MRTPLLIGIVFFLLTGWRSVPGNFMVGRWKSFKLEPFNKRQSISDSLRKSFNSEIVFYEDSTYKKTINGVITTGKYSLEENRLIFLMGEKGNWVRDYSLRWPKGGTDPLPRTREVDFLYPELLPVTNKKGKTVIREVDVYYKKVR